VGAALLAALRGENAPEQDAGEVSG
jgi:hypothetical protein